MPTRYFRFLSHAFPGAAYSNWKVVGWIEALNDLVYFLNVLTQIRRRKAAHQVPETTGDEGERNG